MTAERDPRAWWLDDDPFDKKKHSDNTQQTSTTSPKYENPANPVPRYPK